MGRQGDAHGMAIAPKDLRSCETTDDVFTLFRKLGYPVEAVVEHQQVEEWELPGALRDGVAGRYLVASVVDEQSVAGQLTVTLFALRATEKASPMALARGIAQEWPRRFAGHHLLVFAFGGSDGQRNGQGTFQRLIFVNPRRLGDGAVVRFKLHRLIVERTRPTRHDAETLNRIALPSSQIDAEQLYRLQCQAFDVERLTDEFYKEYAKRFRAAMERIKAENPTFPTFHDPMRLHAFTQRLFGRMLFLYFLQKKGALNGEQDFVTTRFLDAQEADENFYREMLEPLFFDTLNRQRANAASRFGRVPYLNGGLFAAEADDLLGEVYLDNALFDAHTDTGLLGFLNHYNFTIEDDTPLETQVALDPELLGKVFENLLEVEERGKSGTFYTPRAVVAFMCREALTAYLSRSVPELGQERLRWLLDEAETGEPVYDEGHKERLTYHNLSFSLHEQIEQALRNVRVLDPAVGSGAFPLGMLALIVGTRRALHRVRENVIDPQAHLLEDWKRAFIRDCLHGVDIRREAIEIARLRLWLSLVVDADPFTMDPLPNLDFKLMDGDSLIETLDGVEIYPTRPVKGVEQVAWDDAERKRLIKKLQELQQRFYQPERPGDRATLRHDIRDTEVKLVKLTLGVREQNERTRLEANMRKQAMLRGAAVPRELLAEQQVLTRSIAATADAEADIQAGKPLPFFLYRLHFATVFEEKDGFDIVIANPPYVRHEKIAPATLASLKAAYPGVAHGMADLYVYFYARALQLLRDGGTLCFISSNKFFRAGYGKKLRETLTAETSARTVIDFGDFPVFDAAAYPCIVIADKGAPPTDHTYRGLTAGADIELDKIGLTLARAGQDCPQAEGVQPPLSTQALTSLADRILRLGTPLGEYAKGKMFYGIKTGRNGAFVIDAATRNKLVDEDPRSAEVIKPYIRGEDLSRWVVHSAGLWLIFTRQGIDIRNYPAIERYLSHYREQLQPRPVGDTSGKGRKPGSYKWYEIQDTVEYYTSFDEPKIVYPEFAPWPEFSLDTNGYFGNNKIYCIASDSKALVALLNSSTMALALARKCSGVHGGTLEHRTIFVKTLPIVEPAAGDKRQLEALVDQLQALGGVGPQAEALEREMDAIVYRMYGLTAEEIAEIERWHAERRALLGKGKRAGMEEASDAAEDEEEGEEAGR